MIDELFTECTTTAYTLTADSKGGTFPTSVISEGMSTTVNLYAVCTPITYTITYNRNTSSSDTTTTTGTKTYGDFDDKHGGNITEKYTFKSLKPGNTIITFTSVNKNNKSFLDIKTYEAKVDKKLRLTITEVKPNS